MNYDSILQKSAIDEQALAKESQAGLTAGISGAWNRGVFANDATQTFEQAVRTPVQNTVEGVESLSNLPTWTSDLGKGLGLFSEDSTKAIDTGLQPDMTTTGTGGSAVSLPLETLMFFSGGPLSSVVKRVAGWLGRGVGGIANYGSKADVLTKGLRGNPISRKVVNTLGRERVDMLKELGDRALPTALGNITSTEAGDGKGISYVAPDGTVKTRLFTTGEHLLNQSLNMIFDIGLHGIGKGVDKIRGKETRGNTEIARDIADDIDQKDYNIYFNMNKPEIIFDLNNEFTSKMAPEFEPFIKSDGYIDIAEAKSVLGKDKVANILEDIQSFGVGAVKDGDKRMVYTAKYGRIVGKVDKKNNFKVNTDKSDISLDTFLGTFAKENTIYDPVTKQPKGASPDMPSIVESVLMYGKKSPKKSFKDMSLTNVLNAFDNTGSNLTSKYSKANKSGIITKAKELDNDIVQLLKSVEEVYNDSEAIKLDSHKGEDVAQEPTAASTVLLNSEKILETSNVGGKFKSALQFFDNIKQALVLNDNLDASKGFAKEIVDAYKAKIEASRGPEVGGDGSKPKLTDTEKILFNDTGTLKHSVVEAIKAGLADVVSRKAIAPNLTPLSEVSSAAAKKTMDLLGISPVKGKNGSVTLNNIEAVIKDVIDNGIETKDIVGVIKKFEDKTKTGINYKLDGTNVAPIVKRWNTLDSEVTTLGENLGLNSSTLSTDSLTTLEQVNTRDKAILDKYSDVMGEFYNRPTINAVLAEEGTYNPVVKNKEAYNYDTPEIVGLAQVMSSQEFKMDITSNFNGITLKQEMDRIVNMSDSEVAMLIGKEDLYNSPLREQVMSDIREQKAVAKTIMEMIETAESEGKSSVYYPSTILENLRVMQDDPASPQSKNLALYAIRPANTYNQKFNSSNYKDGALAIDTMLDLDNTKMFSSTTDDLHSLFVKIQDSSKDINTLMTEFVSGAKDMNGGKLSIKQALFLRDAYKYLSHNDEVRAGGEFSMPVIGEIDAKASVLANIAAILGVNAEDLRIGIDASKTDFRKTISETIEGWGAEWDGLFDKQAVKDFLTSSKAYRGSPDNMINVMAEYLLEKTIIKESKTPGTFTSDKANPFNKQMEALIVKNYTTQNKQVVIDTLNKYQQLIELREELKVQQKGSSGTQSADLNKQIGELTNSIKSVEDTLKSHEVSIDQVKSSGLSAVDIANLYELKRKIVANNHGDPINENEIASFGKFFRLNYGDRIKNIMDKAIYSKYTVKDGKGSSISGAFTKYTDSIEHVALFGQASFFHEFTLKRFDNPDKIKNAFNDFARTYKKSDGTRITEAEVDELISKFHNTSASIEDVTGVFFDAGFNNDSIYNWSQLDSIIPKIPNPLGGIVRVVQLSGSARFERIGESSFHKQGLTVKTITTPFYMQSIDSGINAHAYTSGVNKFDANVNSVAELLDFGGKANDLISRMHNNSNGFKILEDVLNTELFKKYGKTTVDEYTLHRLATENLVQNGLTPTGKLLEDKITEFRTKLNYDSHAKLANSLNEFSRITDDAKTNLRQNRSTINNYSLEGTTKANDTARVSLDDSPLFNHNEVFGKMSKIEITDSLNLDDLSEVLPASSLPRSFATVTSGNSTVSLKIVDNSDIGITMEGDTFVVNFPDGVFKMGTVTDAYGNPMHPLQAVGHEGGHIALEAIGEANYTKLVELFGTPNRFELLDSKGNIVDPSSFHTEADISMNEFINEILSGLHTNEMIQNNGRAFARLISKDGKAVDLSSSVRQVKIRLPGRVDPMVIKTTKDLLDVVRQLGDDTVASVIQQHARWLNGFWNSPEMKMFMNGERPLNADPYASSKYSKHSMRTFRKYASIVTRTDKVIGKMNFEDLFQLLPTDESARVAWTMNKAFFNNGETAKEEAHKAITELLNDITTGTEENKARDIGKLFFNGVHKWLDDIETNNIIDPDALKLHINRNMDKLIDDVLLDMSDNTLNRTSTEFAMKRAKVEKIIRELSTGKNYVNAIEAGESIAKVINGHISSHKANTLASKLFKQIEKIAAGKRIVTMSSDNITVIPFTHRTQLKAISNLFENQRNTGSKQHFLFGLNPDANYKLRGMRLLPGEKNVRSVGQLPIEILDESGMKQTKTFYLNLIDDNYEYAGKQQSEIIDLTLTQETLGKLMEIDTGDRGNSITVNGNTYKLANQTNAIEANLYHLSSLDNEAVDMSIDKMYVNNVFNNFTQEVGMKMQSAQVAFLKDNNIIMDKYTYEQRLSNMSPEERKLWKEMDKTKMGAVADIYKNYGKMYYNTKYAQNIVGTDGINYGKWYKENFGQFSNFMTNATRGLIGLTQAAKPFVLLARPASYINSFVSSWFIFLNSSHRPWKAASYAAKARKDVKAYRKLMHKWAASKYGNGKGNPDDIMTKMKSMPIHQAFEGGLIQTLRTNQYASSNIESNVFFRMIEKDTSLDTSMVKILKGISFDSSTPWGKTAGDLFDTTELYPKLAMFYDSLEHMGKHSHIKAIGKVLTAYPAYENLSAPLAILDEANPFIKYMSAFPHMLGHAMNNNMGRFAMLQVLFALGAKASWSVEQDELNKQQQWLKENGYINFGGFGKYDPSMNPFDPKAFAPKGNIFEPAFVSIFSNIVEPSKMLGIVPINKD